MKSDIEIAYEADKKHIRDIAAKINLSEEDIIYYGNDKAKIKNYQELMEKPNKGKLILVSALNPTASGSGKTTVSIGLVDALNKLEHKTIGALREPSLGPVFGIKGGATGGGYSQVLPMDEINLHFTGDFHAITSANNLLVAAINNSLYQKNTLNIDPNNITFKYCMDMNDRDLRAIEVGHGKGNGLKRETGFNISAASEIMAIFCLAKNLDDLQARLGNILIGYTYDKSPIYAKDLKVVGSMMALLKDAIKPNLVQTLENNPVFIHGGPFANIAHGCNSIIATKTALSLSDYVVSEAGFGADLGAEKFMDIKCRIADIKPNCVVLVATIKDIKHNGGATKENLNTPNVDLLKKGLCNLDAHINNLKKFGVNIVVALNKFHTDSLEEIAIVEENVKKHDIDFAVCEAFTKGGAGALELAKWVEKNCNKENNFRFLYDLNLSIKDKIDILAKEIYHAKYVEYSKRAEEIIDILTSSSKDALPICIAKTQFSFSDDAKALGDPKDHILHIQNIELYSGAGFITAISGNIMTMPGLGNKPAYEGIKLDLKNDKISGLF